MQISKKLAITVAIAGLALAAACALAAIPSPTIQMRSETRLHPFSQFPNPDYNIVDGATVSVEVNYAAGLDKLYFDYQGSFPITHEWDELRGVLYLQGRAPISEYLDAISTVVFYTTADDFQPRRVTWTLGKGTFYNTLTRHFYRFNQLPGTAFEEALASCAKFPYLGVQGYLATITSYEEQFLISSKTNMSMWIGLATPNVTTGQQPTWTWQSGPEAGQLAWSGNSMYENGMAPGGDVEGAYTAWGRMQPEDMTDVNGIGNTGETYVAVVPTKLEATAWWHNKGNTDGVQGYVCEYGGADAANVSVMLNAAMQNYAGTVVIEYACANYTSATECKNRAAFGCDWNSGVCRQVGCKAHQTEKDCMSDTACTWSTDLSVTLIGRCTDTRCGRYIGKESCDADPVCWSKPIGTTTVCVDATCDSRSTPCACAMRDGCSWQQSCKFEQSLGCDGYDIVYLFDSTSAMNEPFLTFSGGYQGLTDVFLGAEFALTRTSAGVPVTGGQSGSRVGFIKYGSVAQSNTITGSLGMRVTGDVSQAAADLQFIQKGFSPASQRKVSDALTLAMTMLTPDGSTPARKRIVVVMAAGAFDDQAGANAIVKNMTMNNGIIVLGVALKPTQPGTVNSNAAYQSLWQFKANSGAAAVIAAELDSIQAGVIYGVCSPNATLGAAVSMANAGAAIMCSSTLR